MVPLGLPTAAWVALAVVAAFAVTWLGWQALSLWRTISGLKTALTEAGEKVRDAVERVNAEVERVNESMERLGREQPPETGPRGY